MKPLNFMLIVALTAIASHLAALHIIPSAIMSIAMERIPVKGVLSASQDGDSENTNTQGIRAAIMNRQGINAAMPSPRIDHHQRSVVRSTPDILYTACIYDLSVAPLQLTTPTKGGYTSVSAFSSNTDNFFVQDDRSAVKQQLDVTLVPEGWRGNIPTGSKAVISPSNKGIVLFRVLIDNEADLALHVERQRQARCTPVIN